MSKFIVIFLLVILPVQAQQFSFAKSRQKTTIPFKLIGNLIFIPVTVNDVQLTFLLDSGVDETILFSLDDNQEVQLNNVQKVRLRGLGNEGSVDGLHSTQNVVSVGKLNSKAHEIYIIMDADFNFSSHVGIAVNGIIGYELFNDLVLEINYDKQKITFYEDISKVRRLKSKTTTQIPISIEKHKPYLMANIHQNNNQNVKLLIDTGNSDAVWIFNTTQIDVPELNFADYLGRGFSGDIFGKRARIQQLNVGEYSFDQPIAAFPDSTSTRNIKMVENRAGSLGGEILKRFKVVFDYRGKKIYLRKGKYFEADFKYNMSGMEVHHKGVQWVKESVPMKTKLNQISYDGLGDVIRTDLKYKFELKPIYTISGIREDSPAAVAGLQTGDILVKINNSFAHKYSLNEINTILKSTEGKKIQIEVDRKGKVFKTEFYLKKIL